MAMLLFLTGCGPSGNNFQIEGEFTGMKAGELYLFNPNDPQGRIDTLHIVNYHFSYEGTTEDTIPLILLFPNAVEHVIFVSPATSLRYTAAANDLKNYHIEGSAENDLMNQFRTETSSLKEKQIPNTARQYIKENPTSPVSLYLFDRYFLQLQSSTSSQITSILKLLKPHHPDNRLLLSAEGLLKNADHLKKGTLMPNIPLTPTSRKTQNLWDKSTKDYTLIFFWATWLPNGYDILYKVRQLQEANKETMRTVGFSLDNERYRWEDLTRRDSLLIDHSCDGLSWSSPTIQQIGLQTLPFYLITDRTHCILTTGTNMDQLSKDVTKYVKKIED